LVNIEAIDTVIPLGAANGSGSYSLTQETVLNADGAGSGNMAGDAFYARATVGQLPARTVIHIDRPVAPKVFREDRSALAKDLLLARLNRAGAVAHFLDEWMTLPRLNASQECSAIQTLLDYAFETVEL
jgi:hypothetical protein